MLARLLNRPSTQAEWAEWGYHHRTSHDAIRAALQAQRGVALVDYVLDPIFAADMQNFLQRNAQTHIEMDAALGIDSNDLLDVDVKNKSEFDAWIYLHWQEHNQAESLLRI